MWHQALKWASHCILWGCVVRESYLWWPLPKGQQLAGYGCFTGKIGLGAWMFARCLHIAGAFGRPYVSTITNSLADEPVMVWVVCVTLPFSHSSTKLHRGCEGFTGCSQHFISTCNRNIKSYSDCQSCIQCHAVDTGCIFHEYYNLLLKSLNVFL